MSRQPLLVRGDIDGFFGLFIDNLLQLMLIKLLCEGFLGMPADLVTGRIIPGAAVSILVGNLFYAWQARRLMAKTGRTDVTALPYGINTPSLFVYVFFVMAPVYFSQLGPEPADQERAVTMAWQAGLLACFGSGFIEILGAFCGDWLRRHTPRAALLAPLAGIAITFISMGFIFQIFDNPGIALLPAIIILVCYGAKVKTKLPAGLIAIIVGMGLAAIWERFGFFLFEPSPEKYSFAFYPPVPVPADVFALIKGPMAMQFLSVIIPMGLINVIGSLQNLESAEAAGDRFETRPALLANGIGTMAAAFFGSCFPTTIYIGHPGWKAMGARAAYSTVNGVVITAMCLFGGVTLVLQFVPIEATLGILLWIGVIITAQAFGEVPKRHGIAVAVGLIPPLAAWALYLIETALRKADTTLFETAASFGDDRGDVFIYGVIALSQGYLITSLVLAAAMVLIIDRQFYKAAMWMLAASALSIVGLIHAFEWSLNGVKNRFIGIRTDPFMVDVAAPEFGLMYLIGSLVLLSLWITSRRQTAESDPYELDT